MSQKRLLDYLFLLIGILFVNVQSQNVTDIQGVWKVDRIVTTVGDRSYENSNPLPGLMIFTSSFYSMVWMPGSEPVSDNAQIWQPTDQEKINQFDAIIVNSGKYLLRDSLLITEPIVAKTPEFIGGKASYVYTITSDTLRLVVQEIYSKSGIFDGSLKRYRTTIYLKQME